MLIGLIAAIVGGQSIAAALTGLGAAGTVALIQEIANLAPVARALVSLLAPPIAEAVGKLEQGIEHAAIALDLQKWAAANGQGAVAQQEQRYAEDR
jgi:hypothetical protein